MSTADERHDQDERPDERHDQDERPDERHDQDERPDWTAVASYSAGYEMEIPARQLEAAGIPVLVKGSEAGIWGPGFAGPTSTGLTLLVPAAHADEAREILGLE